MLSSLQTSCAEVESPASRPSRFRSALPYLCLGLAVALYLFPFVRVLTWAPDEGAYEYNALMTLHGALPGRDFLEMYAPGSFYWLALFFKLFGASVGTARGLLLCEGVATALLIFHLSRRIGASGLLASIFVVPFSIPLVVMNSEHYDANLFALCSFAVFLAAQRKLAPENPNLAKGRLLLFIAGLLAGCTSCIVQQKGLLFLIALILSLLVLHSRGRLGLNLIVFAGYSCALGAELLVYVVRKGVPDLIYADLTLPLKIYSNLNAVSYGFPLWNHWFPWWFHVTHASFPLPLAVILTVAIGIPFLVIVLAPLLPALAYVWRPSILRRDLLPYWFAAYAMSASEMHRHDIGHLRNGCLLLVVLFFALCETQKRNFPKQLAVLVAGCAVLNGAIYMLGALSAKTVIPTRRGTLLAQKPDKALEFLLAHTYPGQDVFVYPYRPLYYFLADLRNPTRFSTLVYDPSTAPFFQEAIRELDRKKVRYVLSDTMFSGQNLTALFPAYRVPPRDKLILEPYLETHYHQIALENGFRILERNR